MPALPNILEKRVLRMEGDFSKPLVLTGARVEEGINFLTETTLEFVSTDREVDLKALLGSQIKVIEGNAILSRIYPGFCVSAEFLGAPTGVAHYRAELRPWLWFLSRRRENRIFQEKTTIEIVQSVLSDYGFWGNVDNRISATLPARDYAVQYRETDLAFIMRLLEEEGVYFFFEMKDGVQKMVLADDPGAHAAMPLIDPVVFRALDQSGHRAGAHVFSWSAGLVSTTGKVTLWDFDFEKPTADVSGASAIPLGDQPAEDLEAYGYPGHFRDTSAGDVRARVRMEAEAVRHHVAHGAANIRYMAVGGTFDLADHSRETENSAWMMTRATHLMRLTDADNPPKGADTLLDEGLSAELSGDDPYRVLFDVIPKDLQYRAPLVTPWPEIAGVQTAIVVGPSGEEIHTDKYGRVKVQFHWDRQGKKDDKSSCFVRVMTPWSGKNWGMIHIPRIGQEVVVQFEEGNPDRPLVIGMLYNADTMPPYALDANKTQSGIKTNSSKGGGGFNELMFEDKKGSELVRFQAQCNYRQIVKNNAEITVGLETKKDGDMSLTVHNHLTEELKEGDHKFTVTKGKQDIAIKQDRTKTVEGNVTNTITGNLTEEVKQGDVKYTINMGNENHQVKMGNVDYKIDMGNVTTKLGLGNYSLKCDLGKITMEAMQSIELKVGGSSIKIDQMGVTIKGAMMAKMEGGMQAEVKGGLTAKLDGGLMTEVKGGLMTKTEGGAMLMLKGGITMIN
ncbi:type VI secretion system Vgr family protein [Oceaniglobus roseus]|uniref:type VI secretion system Vgr family protein n=1 Tax=Oceaniglobus roseus TaxID=1737570 RepID=UPI000C7F4A77|nr:type VI secretion system tip protein TssI/VgrG [Kandeliimicrobium roseum]